MTTVIPTPQTINPPSPTALQDAQQRAFSAMINCARVGTIVNYDPGEAGVRPPTATVQIAQQQVTSIASDGTKTFADYPPLQFVPVVFLGGGGYCLTWPVAANDECLLIFHDRELDNWFTNGAGLPPTTGRLHDLADAFCIVGLRSGPRALSLVSENSVQLRSDDGSTYVEITAGNIINIKGTLRVTGDIIAGAGTHNISVINHLHSGVQSGGSNTGAPVDNT